MALYEFRCAACGTLTEKRMPMSDVVATVACPQCGKPAARTIGNFAVVGLAKAGVGDGPAPWEEGGGGDHDHADGHGHSHSHGHSHGMDDFDDWDD